MKRSRWRQGCGAVQLTTARGPKPTQDRMTHKYYSSTVTVVRTPAARVMNFGLFLMGVNPRLKPGADQATLSWCAGVCN